MKKLTRLLALGVMVVSLSAFAVYDPTWERPILEARLVELANGHEIGTGFPKKLTMNRRDGQKTATTFTFEEEHQVMCITAPCPTFYRTTELRVFAPPTFGSCHETIYQAVENSRVRYPRRLTLVDNSTNVCDIHLQYQWEVTFYENHQVRKLFGNPEGVVTVQSVLR